MFRRLLQPLVVVLVFSAAASVSFSQITRPKNNLECPRIDVLSSSFSVDDGDMVTFQFEVSGGNIDLTNLDYYWLVDRGKIIDGQGTRVIRVDTAELGSAGSLTVTGQVRFRHEWADGICPQSESETVRVRRRGPQTEADIFWDWFYENERRLYYDEEPGNKGFENEVRAELAKVDAKLRFYVGDKKPRVTKRDLLIGFIGRSQDPLAANAIVDAFVKRAPVLAYFEVRNRVKLPQN